MNSNSRIAMLFLLAPIFLGLLFVVYYQESRRTLMSNLVESGVVALFDGGTVTREDLRNYFQTPPSGESAILRALEMSPQDVSDLEEEDPEWLKSKPGQMLLSRLIKHIALVNYLNAQPESARFEGLEHQVKDYKESLMIQYMEKDLAKIRPTVSQEEVMAYYVDHPEEFHREGKRNARHIMLYDETAGDDNQDPFSTTPESLLRRLQNGEDFHNLVFESQSDSMASSGELGWLTKGALAKNFDQTVWALEVGEITGPIKVRNTLHFVQLLDDQPEGLISFDECAPQIQKQLEEKKRTVQRFKLLGLSKEALSEPNPASTEEYRNALLQAAYAREWDQNSVVARKTQVYAAYRKADMLFLSAMDQLRRSKNANRRPNTEWALGNATIEHLLKKMEFRFMVKLTIPPNGNTEEQT